MYTHIARGLLVIINLEDVGSDESSRSTPFEFLISKRNSIPTRISEKYTNSHFIIQMYAFNHTKFNFSTVLFQR